MFLNFELCYYETMEKTFFIVEDHALMRHGITGWISENSNWVCIGSAGDDKSALQEISSLETLPDLIITDINLGNESDDYSGLYFLKEISKLYPSIKCICYSMFQSPGIIRMAFDSGAKGYVSKNAGEKELLTCMENVYTGSRYIEKDLSQAVITYNSEVESFTKRERSVLNLLIQHKTNDEILGVQKRAIETYISRIYDKTDCKNRQSLFEMFN